MKTTRMWLWFLIIIAGLIDVGGCSGSSNPYFSYPSTGTTTKTNSSPNTIVIYNMAFGPASLTVAKGITVTWQNQDGVAHTATSDNGGWDTGSIPPGGSKSVTFSTSGTFPYHCTIHPMMTATIIVQ